MKTVILTLPMREQSAEKQVFIGNDGSIRTSDKGYVYAINSYLEKNVSGGEKIKIILVAKVDDPVISEHNVELYKRDIEQISDIDCEFCVIKSDFTEDPETHNKLLYDLINAVPEDSEVICDYTFGPKDLSIVIFAALSFVEKFFGCEISRLLYVYTHFVDNKAKNTILCDVSYLLYISAVTNNIDCKDADEARKLLKTILK